MKQQASVEVERPIDEVFQYTNDHVAEYLFEDLGGSSRVTQQSNAVPKGMLLPVRLEMMRKSTCKAVENELNRLKLVMESRPSSEF